MKSKIKVGLKIGFLTVLGCLVMAIYRIIRLLKRRTNKVADYDKKIEIWNDVPGNANVLKKDKMNIRDDGNLLAWHVKFDLAISSKKYRDAEQIIDTFTYKHEVEGGYEKETFEDRPYIIPYLTDESDAAIIILPGGGFGYKSMDGRDDEGKAVAVTLQQNGINAFVLHYRSNPYEYPVPQLDLQRAIRFLKFHSSKYNINPNKIGLIGFSAGGFVSSCHINMVRGKNLFSKYYILDEIDTMDDNVLAVGLIYPAITLKYNVPMLFAMFNADDVRNEETRNKILEKYDLKTYLSTAKDIPQFIAWGTRDLMVGTKAIKEYINECKKSGVKVKEIIAPRQEHGFAQKYYMDDFIKWFKNII
ncbi:alpha/beta hydrolase [Lachnobacterium bovis]|uniref:Alpha/beta hydrolase family protein n=1 Tax=Lachnobacterium bovis TaxID=140626 RepID=A0A1H9PA87_9FIRM|nr:alpha/beta hydrolase [Lachnobacterium bovis]SER45164.1 Alpha/beta hydrolase family protein [Lachnobacterium bovis]